MVVVACCYTFLETCQYFLHLHSLVISPNPLESTNVESMGNTGCYHGLVLIFSIRYSWEKTILGPFTRMCIYERKWHASSLKHRYPQRLTCQIYC